jgi:hypothetical protein
MLQIVVIAYLELTISNLALSSKYKNKIYKKERMQYGTVGCKITSLKDVLGSVLRIQTLLIRIRILLFNLIPVRIWIQLFDTDPDPDPYHFKEVM